MNVKQKIAMRKEIKMNRCRYCFSTENLTIDHKNPISKGGNDELKNLQCLCRRCNGIKSNLSHGEVKRFFTWFAIVNTERVIRGKRPWADNRVKKILNG